jgi:hypothetical protein
MRWREKEGGRKEGGREGGRGEGGREGGRREEGGERRAKKCTQNNVGEDKGWIPDFTKIGKCIFGVGGLKKTLVNDKTKKNRKKL